MMVWNKLTISRRFLHQSTALRGALTSKPYAFVARPWELRNTLAIDNLNAVGSNIVLQTRGTEVLRILPRVNDDVNEEWIDDKTRFSYDGLKRQRLTKPLARDLVNKNQWDPNVHEWRDVFARIRNQTKSALKSSGIKSQHFSARAICGASSDLQSILALTDLMEVVNGDSTQVPVEHASSAAFSCVNCDLPTSYRFNTTFSGTESADVCLLVGTNLSVDAPLITTRLRKAFLRDNIYVASIGFRDDLSFPSEQLGLTAETLLDIATGKHEFCERLKSAEWPMMIVDSSLFERADGIALAAAVNAIATNKAYKFVKDSKSGAGMWNGLNFVHRQANDVGLLELGRTKAVNWSKWLKSGKKEKIDFLYLMNVSADDLPDGSQRAEIIDALKDSAKFIVLQSSHGDELTRIADVVLPGAAYTEKDGIYVNMEGRVQRSKKSLVPVGQAREDWKIVRAVSEVIGSENPVGGKKLFKLPYDTQEEINERLKLLVPSVGNEGEVVYCDDTAAPEGFMKVVRDAVEHSVSEEGKIGNMSLSSAPFVPVHYDFHLQGHIVAKYSQTMAKCSKDFNNNDQVNFPASI